MGSRGMWGQIPHTRQYFPSDPRAPSLAALFSVTTTLTALSLQRNDFTQTGVGTGVGA